MIRYILIFFTFLSILNCDLAKTNPLEVENIPQTPNNLTLGSSPEGSEEKFVNITWDLVSEQNFLEGVNIYRSTVFDGEYVLIKQVAKSQDYYKDLNVSAGYMYFYKVSCYNKDGLEGYLSSFKNVTVKE